MKDNRLKRGAIHTLKTDSGAEVKGTVQELAILLGVTAVAVQKKLHKLTEDLTVSNTVRTPTPPIVPQSLLPRQGPQPPRPAHTTLTGVKQETPKLIKDSPYHQELIAYIQYWMGGDQQRAKDDPEIAYTLVSFIEEGGDND